MTTALAPAGTPVPDPSPKRRHHPDRLVLYVIALFVLGVILLPIAFSVLGGFRSNEQLVKKPVGLPNPWVPGNYSQVLHSDSFWQQLRNSTVIATLTAAIVLPVASLTAFALARYRFRGREWVYGLFTLGLMFPVANAILPLFITLRQVHLLSNPLGVALPQAAFGLPLAIVIMRPFIRAIPQEVQDAAALDGCGAWGFYWRVVLPLSRPVLSTVAVITIVASWNSFLLPLLVLVDPNQHTLPIGVNNISTQYTTDYAKVLAYTTLSMIPALGFYAIAERQIVGGLTAGAVRE